MSEQDDQLEELRRDVERIGAEFSELLSAPMPSALARDMMISGTFTPMQQPPVDPDPDVYLAEMMHDVGVADWDAARERLEYAQARELVERAAALIASLAQPPRDE